MSPFWGVMNNVGIVLTVAIALFTLIRRAAQMVKTFAALVESHRSLVSQVEDLSKIIGAIKDELTILSDTYGHGPGESRNR